MKVYFTTDKKLNLSGFLGCVYCTKKLKVFFVVEEDDSGNDLITSLALALANEWWKSHDDCQPLPVGTFAKLRSSVDGILLMDAVAALSSLMPPSAVIDELNSSASLQEDNMMSQRVAYKRSFRSN